MEHTAGAFDLAKNKIAEDFKTIVSDGEDLIKVAASTTADGLAAARAKISDRAISAGNRIADASQPMIEKAKQANGYVHGNPWPVIGVAAVVGLTVGLAVGLLATKR